MMKDIYKYKLYPRGITEKINDLSHKKLAREKINAYYNFNGRKRAT